MSENAQTKITTHDDGKFERTAIVLDGDKAAGSVDVLDAEGKLLVRLNLFGKQSDDGTPWFAVDVIDIAERFTSRRGLIFNDGCMADIEADGPLVAVDFRCDPKRLPETMSRDEIIVAVQDYCADIHESGEGWAIEDGKHVAALLNKDENPGGLFRFMDEKTGDSRVGYRTSDGREWFHILRQMRNKPGSGLLENLGK